MRRFPMWFVIAAFCFLSPVLAQDAATYKVQDGASPWSDRVGAWELGDVPASLKSDDSLPQQNCSARSLTVTGKPKSITIGVSEADLPKFKEKYPEAKETGDKITIRRPKETTGMPYVAVTLANPSDTISGGDVPFGAGLLFLKIESDATTQPATKP